MADPTGPKPVIEPKPPHRSRGDSGGMNGFLDVGMVLSLAATAVFLIAGTALPFISHERKEHR